MPSSLSRSGPRMPGTSMPGRGFTHSKHHRLLLKWSRLMISHAPPHTSIPWTVHWTVKHKQTRATGRLAMLQPLAGTVALKAQIIAVQDRFQSAWQSTGFKLQCCWTALHQRSCPFSDSPPLFQWPVTEQRPKPAKSQPNRNRAMTQQCRAEFEPPSLH